MYCNNLKAIVLGVCFALIATPVLAATPLNVVTVTNDFASIAKAIGRDHVKVQSLVQGSHDVHDIYAKPSMVVKLRKADLFIRLGMSQDSWADGVVQTARKARFFKGGMGVLDASEGIEKLDVPDTKIDGSGGDVHLEGNPHYWLAPSNGIIIGQRIMERFIVLDPENELSYQQNFETFKKKINSHLALWKQTLAPYRTHRFISYHKVWAYFFKEFGLIGLGELETLPGIPPTTRHLYELKLRIKQEKKPVQLLMANYYDHSIGKSFSKSVGAKLAITPIHASSTNSSAYTDLIDRIIIEIREDG